MTAARAAFTHCISVRSPLYLFSNHGKYSGKAGLLYFASPSLVQPRAWAAPSGKLDEVIVVVNSKDSCSWIVVHFHLPFLFLFSRFCLRYSYSPSFSGYLEFKLELSKKPKVLPAMGIHSTLHVKLSIFIILFLQGTLRIARM